MGLIENFDRLAGLIEERENHGDMKGLLVTIRDQVEQSEKEKAALAIHASALELEKTKTEAKQLESVARLKADNTKLVETIAQLKTKNQTPSFEVIDLSPMEPPENFI